MGVTKIETIGWDIADKCGKNTHYYDQRSLFRINDSGLRRILEKIRIIHIYNYFLYLAGKKYNHADMLEGEAVVTSNAIPKLIRWLGKHGIRLEINSNTKWTNKQ